MTAPAIALIAAVGRNGVIGDGAGMPWRLSTDLRRFKTLTLGKPVIMGRRTYQTIGKPLPERANIVVTRQATFAPEGVTVARSVDEAVALGRQAAEASRAGEVMVIGGGEIYAALIDVADRLYVTHVLADPAGSVHFPVIDAAVWRRVSAEEVPAGDRDSAPTLFAIYERRESAG